MIHIEVDLSVGKPKITSRTLKTLTKLFKDTETHLDNIVVKGDMGFWNILVEFTKSKPPKGTVEYRETKKNHQRTQD